jgi:hypothetical protein
MPFKPLELYEYMNTSNFYVLCIDDRYDLRMFDDFEADAALIISEPNEFSRRLSEAVARQDKTLRMKAGQVKYYDPYTVQRHELEAGFSKNFKFAYQNEYRMTWWPSESEPLAPIFVEAGSLSDIAEAVFV